jgi:hypothetical protein
MPVMQRKMFANGGQAKSEGILSGFEDTTEDGYENRTPENLEIIANNLRGDIRSMDERYLELATLVGESAFDTPEEVVALMQGQLAQQAPPQDLMQGAQGIEALGAPPAPPEGGILAGFGQEQGMPQPGMEQGMDPSMAQGMPQEMPPGMEQPVQMADGGIVYRQAGSPPTGEVSLDQLGRYARAFGAFGEAPRAPYDPRTYRTPGMAPASINAIRYGDMSPQAQAFIQSGAGRAGELPKQIPRGLQYSTKLYEAMRNVGPFLRDVRRTAMGTPQGRFATGIAALGASALPFLSRDEAPSEGGPIYSQVPGVDAQGNYVPVLQTLENMPATDEQRNAVRTTGFDPNLNPEQLGFVDQAIADATPQADAAEEVPVGEEEVPTQVTPAPGVTVPPRVAAPDEGEKSYRERVKDKMNLYQEFLGSDPEMRKAQALFILAETALNVAGARGTSIGERLATGFKGAPSAFGALAAESEKDRRAIASAAIQSVDSEIAADKKNAALIARELIKAQNKAPGKAQRLAQVIMKRTPGISPEDANLLAEEMDLELIKYNEPTGEYIDKFDGSIRHNPNKPLSEKSVGYISPDNPFAQVSKETLEPVLDPEERKALYAERQKLQRNLPLYDRFLVDVYGDNVGILPTLKSGVSQFTLALFGDVGLGLTDVKLNAIRQKSGIASEYVTRGLFRNSSRVSNLDMTRTEDLVKDPNKLAQSAETVVSNVQNFAVADMNRLAEIDHQLGLTPSLVQMGRIPTGAKSDPLPLTRNIGPVLDQIFTKRPNAEIWTKLPDGRTAKMTAADYFAQKNAQGQAQ